MILICLGCFYIIGGVIVLGGIVFACVRVALVWIFLGCVVELL